MIVVRLGGVRIRIETCRVRSNQLEFVPARALVNCRGDGWNAIGTNIEKVAAAALGITQAFVVVACALGFVIPRHAAAILAALVRTSRRRRGEILEFASRLAHVLVVTTTVLGLLT